MSFASVSGNPALDLAATVGSRRGDAFDLLSTPTDLERWVDGCANLPDGVHADDASFATALTLREAIYELALDRVRERRFDADALATVNASANGPLPTLSLTDKGAQTSGNLAAVLTQLARDAVTVLGDSDAILKECSRPECTRIYLDRSCGSRRTWCGMDECGNRVKAAAYRARRRSAARDA